MAKSENKQAWEESEFPFVCEPCLGPNPYVRMTKQAFGDACKICDRPFAIFRWCPGGDQRFKKTEICQICARMKNACQSCVLDLQFGLTLQIRDDGLMIDEQMPTTDINRQFFAQNAESTIRNDPTFSVSGRVESAGKELLRRMARNNPYKNKDKMPHCTLYARGECKRGDQCPYLHELIDEDSKVTREIRDRELALQDPHTLSLLEKTKQLVKMTPPVDQSITSLFLTGVPGELSEEDIRSQFYVFGEIKSVHVVRKSNCAFVNFSKRTAAESAAESCFHGIEIKGHRLRVAWGRPKPLGPSNEIKAKEPKAQEGMPLPPPGTAGGTLNYPSQDPTLLGALRRH